MKKLLCLLICGVLVFTSLSFVSASEAVNEEPGSTYEGFAGRHELVDFLTENNVPDEKIELLVHKSENGILWDCYVYEKVSLIPASFYEFDINGNVQDKYFRFEDGSFIKISVEGDEVIENFQETYAQEETGDAYQIVTDSFGTLYKNHKVSRTVGTTSAWFYANFYIPRTGNSRIYTYQNSAGLYNSPYGEEIRGFGTTAHPYMQMIRDTEGNGQAALFRLYWFNQITISGGWSGISGTVPVGSTQNLYLALINGKMYIDCKLPF